MRDSRSVDYGDPSGGRCRSRNGGFQRQGGCPTRRQLVENGDSRRLAAGREAGGNTGRYSISIAANGHFALGRILGTISAASGYHRVTIGGVCRSAKGVFSWNIAGPKLTLAKVHDRCAEADGLLVGVWTRY